jgi:phage shock protein PspC (stress-responsive transcriptional regulator)
MNRRLYRSRRDSVLGGVCGGVADYLDMDPSIVRIIWAVLTLVTGGLFLVLYIVMWIVVPEGPSAATVAHAAAEGASGTASTPGEQPASTPAEASAPAWGGHEERLRRGGSGGALIFGLILIGAGVWFLVDEYIPAFDPDLVWPIALVAVGAALLFVSLRRRT